MILLCCPEERRSEGGLNRKGGVQGRSGGVPRRSGGGGRRNGEEKGRKVEVGRAEVDKEEVAGRTVVTAKLKHPTVSYVYTARLFYFLL